MSLAAVKALTFDVFGTVVDWRGSLIRECTEFGAARWATGGFCPPAAGARS
jgi:hypothetical protein